MIRLFAVMAVIVGVALIAHGVCGEWSGPWWAGVGGAMLIASAMLFDRQRL